MRGKTALGVRYERITGAFFFDGEEGFVGFGGAGAVESFAGAALIIINGGEDVIARDIVEEDGSGFAAAVRWRQHRQTPAGNDPGSRWER